MAAVSKEDLMRYCRVDDEDTGEDLVKLADAAERKLLRTCKVQRTDANAEEYDLCVKAMTLHQFDHPGEAYTQGIRDQINELKDFKF